MEIKIIIITLLTLVLNCSNNPASARDNATLKQAAKYSARKTITSDGYYKFCFKGDTTYTIVWGNKSFKNKTKRAFDVLGNGTLNLLKSGNNAIILSQGCGTSCVYYVVLPLNPSIEEKVFMPAIAYDIDRNLIAYIADESFIIIENYLTGQKMDIIEENLCPAAFKGDCIDSCYFNSDSFVIEWQGSKWTNEKPDPQKKIVQIEF